MLNFGSGWPLTKSWLSYWNKPSVLRSSLSETSLLIASDRNFLSSLFVGYFSITKGILNACLDSDAMISAFWSKFFVGEDGLVLCVVRAAYYFFFGPVPWLARLDVTLFLLSRWLPMVEPFFLGAKGVPNFKSGRSLSLREKPPIFNPYFLPEDL